MSDTNIVSKLPCNKNWIFICTKCENRIKKNNQCNDQVGAIAHWNLEDFKNFKKELKINNPELMMKNKIVLSSCLSLCPDEASVLLKTDKNKNHTYITISKDQNLKSIKSLIESEIKDF